jgi:hypothetical protein
MSNDNDTMHLKAKELIERLGKAALQYAHDRTNLIKEHGDARALDQAYLLLSEVESLLAKES